MIHALHHFGTFGHSGRVDHVDVCLLLAALILLPQPLLTLTILLFILTRLGCLSSLLLGDALTLDVLGVGIKYFAQRCSVGEDDGRRRRGSNFAVAHGRYRCLTNSLGKIELITMERMIMSFSAHLFCLSCATKCLCLGLISTCTVRELDLSNNSIHHLDEVVDLTGVVCRITHLNLSHNALGDFDEDSDGEVSVGTGLTCGALGALLSQYTSLKHLDLSGNALHNAEVRACQLI